MLRREFLIFFVKTLLLLREIGYRLFLVRIGLSNFLFDLNYLSCPAVYRRDGKGLRLYRFYTKIGSFAWEIASSLPCLHCGGNGRRILCLSGWREGSIIRQHSGHFYCSECAVGRMKCPECEKEG